MTDVPKVAAEFIPGLWDLHRVLKPRQVRGDLKTQTLRARAAVDLAIAEVTSLHQANGRTPTGVLDLDAALNHALDEGRTS